MCETEGSTRPSLRNNLIKITNVFSVAVRREVVSLLGRSIGEVRTLSKGTGWGRPVRGEGRAGSEIGRKRRERITPDGNGDHCVPETAPQESEDEKEEIQRKDFSDLVTRLLLYPLRTECVETRWRARRSREWRTLGVGSWTEEVRVFRTWGIQRIHRCRYYARNFIERTD